MSQRHSQYPRQPNDNYITPRWVYEALYSVEPWAKDAWDCAPVNADFDFLSPPTTRVARGIVTNPPFSLADKFVRHAMLCSDKVAMLLPVQFDCANGRRDLFADSKRFRVKYTILKRIRWENLKQKKAGPSQNHAWYVWLETHNQLPFMAWL